MVKLKDYVNAVRKLYVFINLFLLFPSNLFGSRGIWFDDDDDEDDWNQRNSLVT